MPIENLARSEVVTATPDTTVPELAQTMDEHDVGSVVITDGDTPVGIVTDRDVTIRTHAQGRTADDMTAENVMTENLCTIERSGGFYEATNLMSEWGVRRLPVTDDGSLVGIITADDITELLADEQEQLANVIRTQRPEY